MSSDKTQVTEKSCTRFGGKRRWLPVAGTIICGLFLAYFISITFINSALEDYKHTMISGIGYGRMEYEHNIEKDDLYYISNCNLMEDLTGFTAFTYEENGYSSDVRDELLTDVGTYCYYFFFRGSIDPKTETCHGYLNKESRAQAFPELSEKELYTLLSTGYYRRATDITYTASPVGNEGYAILSWNTEEILKKQSVLRAYSKKYDEAIIRVNLETGLIEDATDAGIIGSTCDSLVSLDELKAMKPNEAGIIRLADGTRTYGVVDDSEDDELFCSYVEFASIIPDVARTITLPVVLGWAFLMLMLLYVLRFTKGRRTQEDETDGNKINEDREDEDKEYIHIFGKYYADRLLYIHSMGILLFAGFLVVIALVYVQTLIRFSTQNVRANNNLETLESMMALNKENSELMEGDFLETREILVDAIASYYMRHPEQENNDSLGRLVDKLPYISEISIYDKECTMLYGTDGNIGYTISSDSNRPESVCWNIINGIANTVVYKSSADDSRTMVVGRRQCGTGIIRIRPESEFINEFSKLTDVESCVSSAYFGAAEKAYIDKQNSEVLHWMKVGDFESDEVSNSLTDSMLQNGYAGITRIFGNRYYINTRNSDSSEYILVSARMLKELIGLDNGKSLAFLVIALLVQQVMLVIGSAEKFEIEPKKRKKITANDVFRREDLNDTVMNEVFRKTVKSMFIITCLMIAFLLGFDSMYGKTSLLGYLFQSTWEKGFNLFSVTMILIMSACVIVGGALLQAMIFFFTKNMGPRGVTIGRLLSSIIKFIILIFVVANILIDLGVSGSVLLTGAGVAGVVISFCAQSTLNDFLSGFFIVFEGLFNIGDWITVNDFRGQVVEIGIRKTRLAMGDMIYCVSNSELKDLTIMPENLRGAVVYIDIAYKEDVDEVMELIASSADIYRSEIPELHEGPYVEGINGLKDSGVQLKIWAPAEQAYAAKVERAIRRITKRIFDENGITIPFPQVTIHTED